MLNKYLLVILVFVVTMLFVAPYLGVSGIPMIVLLTAAIVGGLALMKSTNVFKLSRMQGIALLAVPLFVVGMYSGWLVTYGITPATLGLAPATTAGIVTPTAVAPSTAQAACKEHVASTNSDAVGTAASLVFAGWDLESNTPYSSTVNIGTDCFIYVNGNEAVNYAGPTTATSSTAHTALANVGDIIYVYCGGSSYYTEPVEALCVDSVNFPVNLMTHTAIAETNAKLSCYDNTGAVACSTADNTSIGDWDITLGAGSDDSFYIRTKANVAVKAWNFMGFAIMVNNDIDDARPISGQGFTSAVVPKFLKGLTVSPGTAGSTNNLSTASYDYYYKRPSPVLMSQWQYNDYGFTIEASDSSDPAETNIFSTADSVIICALDGQYAKGTDGKIHLNAYAETIAQANVGITELFDIKVAGATSCGVLYGI
jgi:hypothetical protein